jgi:Sulfotransferase family
LVPTISPSAKDRPILVTGAHRSGTTWVGKMLALARGLQYIHEPFNPVAPAGVCAADFDHYFVYVTRCNETRYLSPLSRTLAFRYSWLAAARETGTLRGARRAIHEGLEWEWARLRSARPLVKDPLALLSSEWLAERFGMEVLVMIRHPAAFVSSVKRLDWQYSFAELLADRQLMTDHLSGFETELHDHVRRPQDILSQAVLTWRVLYSVVATFRGRHPEWLFVRHEDISLEPTRLFGEIYRRLHLDLTERVLREIEEHSGSANPHEVESAYSTYVNSRANVSNWHKRLSNDEIVRIRNGVEDVSHAFYSDEDWQEPKNETRT